MNPGQTFLYSSPDFRLYFIKEEMAAASMWQLSAKYPVSLVFYLKGNSVYIQHRKEQVLLADTANVCRLFYMAEGEHCLYWPKGGATEFFELRMTKAFFTAILPADHESWKTFIRKAGNPGVSSLPEAAFAVRKESKEILYALLQPLYELPALQQLLVQGKVRELLALFLYDSIQPHERTAVTAKEKMLAKKAQQYLEKLPYREEFTIISLAAELGTNETTLKVAFKKVLGTTIYKYYHKNRMDKAVRLLKAGNSVTKTAGLVGYRQMSHFSYIFKEYFGVSPTKIYR